MLAIRLHLDDCNDRNGALRVVAGSHRLGRLNSIDARRERDKHGDVVISVPRGGVMLMSPPSAARIVQGPRRYPASGTALRFRAWEVAGGTTLQVAESMMASLRNARRDTGCALLQRAVHLGGPVQGLQRSLQALLPEKPPQPASSSACPSGPGPSTSRSITWRSRRTDLGRRRSREQRE
jgi:Phytanoyl-CoA dioxygenase (PhyH)